MVHIPRWQMFLVLAVIIFGAAFAAPNLFGRNSAESLPGWLPSDQINLGLDLQGGSYFLMEAGLDVARKEQLENLLDGVREVLRTRRLEGQKIGYVNLALTDGRVEFRLLNPEIGSEVRRLILDTAPGIQVTTESDGAVHAGFSDSDLRTRDGQIMEQLLKIVLLRVDETGTREASVQRQGDSRIVLQLPGDDAPEEIKERLQTEAKMTFHLVEENLTPGVDRIPPRMMALASPDKDANGNPIPVRRYVLQKRAMVSGENLVDAQPSFRDARPVVTFRFDTLGAKRFADATQRNVGRLFAIVLDGKVISAPVIREPILGGSGEISGSFTITETQELALLLRAGALPAPLKFLEERTVGPGLGADSVAAGKIASLLGMVFVVIFMGLCYGLFGVMANIALIVNLVLIVSVLSVLQATLTLPGIAGIVLTIGMAVDANVLIFERIREESRLGRGPVNAIDAGYKRAMTTIIDSNLTTLIAALLLFEFGSGPVKGFAVTLSIGLVTSMFSAIMVTRLLVVLWLRRKRPQALPV